MSTLSERIYQAIKRAGLSYGELAEKTHIPKSALQRYATGETEKIKLARIQAIAEATGTDPKWLIGWTDDKQESANRAQDMDRLEAMHQNPKLGLLFDRQRNMSDKDIEMMLALSERISKEEYGD